MMVARNTSLSTGATQPARAVAARTKSVSSHWNSDLLLVTPLWGDWYKRLLDVRGMSVSMSSGK
jgi:hypothetical protein